MLYYVSARGGGLKHFEATMVETHQNFGKRVADLNRKNVLMANGYYTTVRADGLVIARPAKRSIAVPFKTLLLLGILFFIFKALVLSSIGPGTYQIRLGKLQSGTVIEQAGAWVLGIDPVTKAISTKVGPIFRG